MCEISWLSCRKENLGEGEKTTGHFFKLKLLFPLFFLCFFFKFKGGNNDLRGRKSSLEGAPPSPCSRRPDKCYMYIYAYEGRGPLGYNLKGYHVH